MSVDATENNVLQERLQRAEDEVVRLREECRHKDLFRAALAVDAVWAFEADLTDDRLDWMTVTDVEGTLFQVGDNYSTYVRHLASILAHPDYLTTLLCGTRREELLQQHQQGQDAIGLEFLCADGRWLHFHTRMIPDSKGHVHAAMYIKDVSRRKNTELHLLERARRDALTGLLQRNAASAEVDQWCSTWAGRGAMLIVDIDDFKRVNDTCGHVRGDQILCLFVEEIRATFHLDDVLGRIGGDEFVVFMRDAPSAAFAEKRARELCQRVVENISGEEIGGTLSCSVGIALFPEHGSTFNDLYERADEAQYYAKKHGKNQVSIYGEFDGTVVFEGNFTSTEWLLEELSEAIYVCKMSDYSLLYVNKHARDAFPLEARDAYFRHTCYELFLGRTSPCPDCRKNDLPEDGFLEWEFTNPCLQRRYLIKGKKLQWNGIPAFLECAIDITPTVEKQKILDDLHYRAEHDLLTGLYNREAFSHMVRDMLYTHPQTQYVILRWDIERFKVVNDLFGVDTGDNILRAVAATFSAYAGEVGICGRLEADHFVACLPREHLDMERLCAEVDACVAQFQLSYKITSNFGLYAIENVMIPVDQMCDRAKLAQRTVKGSCLLRYAWYDEALRDSLLDEQHIIGEMYTALQQRQFVVYFQPIYSVSQGQPISAEALVRWIHPENGIISPSEFIPLFERNGFIMQLDAYVLEEVCRHLRRMQDSGRRVLPVSVNLSRINLFNAHICDDIIALVQRYNVDPSLLKLEITESAYTENQDTLLEVMCTLQERGFVILMDDFGSGYSSLNMLKDVPVDVLKIDMKFLSNVETSGRSGSILTSIVRMARWLNMDTIAEGVETRAQLDFLCSIGCDKVQGYFYSRPLPMEDYENLIQNCQPQGPLPVQAQVDFDAVWNADPRADLFFRSLAGGIGLYELCADTLEVVRVNDLYYEILKCKPDSLFWESRDILCRVLPEDRPRLLAVCRDAAANRCMGRIVLCRLLQDGGYLWLDMNIRYIGDTGPRAMFYFFFSDVTTIINERRQLAAEAALHRLAVLNTGTVTFDYDVMQDMLLYEKHTHYERQRATVQNWQQQNRLSLFVCKEDLPECRRRMAEACADEVEEKFFLQLALAGHRSRVYFCQYVSLRDMDTGLIFRVVGALSLLE